MSKARSASISVPADHATVSVNSHEGQLVNKVLQVVRDSVVNVVSQEMRVKTV